MGRFLVKQPNGRYCLFSTIVDCPTYVNLTEEDYIQIYLRKAESDVKEYLQQLKEHPELSPSFEEMDKYFYPNNMSISEYNEYKKIMQEPVNEKDKYITT